MLSRRQAIITSALLLALAAAGCGGTGILERRSPRGTAAGPPAARSWTVMVYMDADGDLEEFGVLNMNQMESVGSTAGVSIVVQMDRIPGFDATNDDWTDTRRYLIRKDGDPQQITSPVQQSLGEVDMGDPASLREFIQWGVTNFPAEHFALVAWNHGSGWRSRPMPPTTVALSGAKTRGISFDDTSNSSLTMAEFDSGLSVPGVHLDLIAMDASLMGMLEVAYEVRNRADYLAFSEESPPGRGYPYDRILSRLAANPSMGAEALGRIFVQEHLAAYPDVPVTQSLVRTAGLTELARRVDALAAALQAALPARRAELDLARTGTQAYTFNYYRDLFDFATRVKAAIPDASVQAAADAVLAGLPGARGGPVLAESHSAVRVAGSHGLSIYLPGPGQLFSGYTDLAVTRDFPRWSALLRQWLGAPGG